jgi:hypothetical protein
MKIVVESVFPPIPSQDFDYVAYVDGEEERRHYGYGRSRAEALKAFIEQYEDDLDV